MITEERRGIQNRAQETEEEACRGAGPVLSARGGPGEGDSNLKEHVRSRGCPKRRG